MSPWLMLACRLESLPAAAHAAENGGIAEHGVSGTVRTWLRSATAKFEDEPALQRGRRSGCAKCRHLAQARSVLGDGQERSRPQRRQARLPELRPLLVAESRRRRTACRTSAATEKPMRNCWPRAIARPIGKLYDDVETLALAGYLLERRASTPSTGRCWCAPGSSIRRRK